MPQNSLLSRSAPLALVLGDDLTGACDAGMAFARQGLTTRVGLGMVPAEAADVLVLSTNSRSMEPQAAANLLATLASELPLPGEIGFRKIDSTLRGNIVSECDATLEALRLPYGVLAPSLPAQGRTVRGGILTVSDIAGSWTLSVPDLFREQGGRIISLPIFERSEDLQKALQAAASAGARYLLCDAATERHLGVIAKAVAACEPRPLWIGSAGLAAEAARLVSEPCRRRSPFQMWEAARGSSLLCIGSTHAVSLMQMKHLDKCSEIPVFSCRTASPDAVGAAIAAAGTAALRMEMGEVDSVRLRPQLEAAVAAGIRRIVLTGGDTAEFVCRTAAAGHLLLEGEILPGVATGSIQDGLLHGIAFATKSGGFGQEDCLTQLLAPAFLQGSGHRKEQL